MEALGRITETAGPIARQKAFARALRNATKARLVVDKSFQRGFGATRGKTAIRERKRILRNIFADGRRCCIQWNCSASVEPPNAVVELLPSAIICATRSK